MEGVLLNLVEHSVVTWSTRILLQVLFFLIQLLMQCHYHLNAILIIVATLAAD